MGDVNLVTGVCEVGWGCSGCLPVLAFLSEVDLPALGDGCYKRPVVLLANTSHLSIGLHEQISRVANPARCEDKFADFELVYELPLQESRALLLVKRDQNPFSFADSSEQNGIVGCAAKELSMPLVPDSGAIQLFD